MGPLADPGDLEADIESFMKLTKVQALQPALLPEAAAGSPPPHLASAPGHNATPGYLSGGWTGVLTSSLLSCPFSPPACACSSAYVISYFLSLMLSPGGAKREWTPAGPDRGQEGGSDSEAGQPEKGQTVTSLQVAPWEVTVAFSSLLHGP